MPSLGPWAIFYGALAAATLALSLRTRCPGTRRAAGFLLVAWVIYNLIRPTVAGSVLADYMRWLDVVGAGVGLSLLGRHGKRYIPWPATWVWVYIGCFAAQMAAHVWKIRNPDVGTYGYYLTLNVLFLGQCGAAAWPSLLWLGREKMHFRVLHSTRRP